MVIRFYRGHSFQRSQQLEGAALIHHEAFTSKERLSQLLEIDLVEVSFNFPELFISCSGIHSL